MIDGVALVTVALAVGVTAELREIVTDCVCVPLLVADAGTDSDADGDTVAVSVTEVDVVSTGDADALLVDDSDGVLLGVCVFDGDAPIVRAHTHCRVDVHSVTVGSELKYRSLP